MIPATLLFIVFAAGLLFILWLIPHSPEEEDDVVYGPIDGDD